MLEDKSMDADRLCSFRIVPSNMLLARYVLIAELAILLTDSDRIISAGHLSISLSRCL